jgi:hypothetical protein
LGEFPGALIISDEMKGSQSGDQILIQRHIMNVKKEIAIEEKRKKKLDDLKRIFATNKAANANQSEEPMTDNFDFGFKDTINLDLIESELQDVDYGEGQFISKRHQVLVQVGRRLGNPILI